MTMRFNRKIATTIAVAALASLAPEPGRAGETLGLRASPRVAVEPATLTIRVTLEPFDQNRGLEIQVDSGEHQYGTFIQLDGVDAPRTTTLTYPQVPAGNYEVRARLVGPGGKTRATTAQDVTILSRSGR